MGLFAELTIIICVIIWSLVAIQVIIDVIENALDQNQDYLSIKEITLLLMEALFLFIYFTGTLILLIELGSELMIRANLIGCERYKDPHHVIDVLLGSNSHMEYKSAFKMEPEIIRDKCFDKMWPFVTSHHLRSKVNKMKIRRRREKLGQDFSLNNVWSHIEVFMSRWFIVESSLLRTSR